MEEECEDSDINCYTLIIIKHEYQFEVDVTSIFFRLSEVMICLPSTRQQVDPPSPSTRKQAVAITPSQALALPRWTPQLSHLPRLL